MDLLTLQKILTHAPTERLRNYLPHLQAAMEAAEINTAMRQAMFLAQIAHESCEFRYLKELWGPSSQQLRYDPPGSLAAMLGNTAAGDGKRYMGRGVIQITGKANYTKAGNDLHLDLVNHPEIAEDPAVGFQLGAWFWTTHKLNAYADRGDLVGCTRQINGGQLGLEQRKRYYDAALQVLIEVIAGTTPPNPSLES
jgi:putative chitinase